MESVLRGLVQAREDALIECDRKAKEVIRLCTDGSGTTEMEFMKSKLQLKNAIDAYDVEVNRLLQNIVEETSRQLISTGLSTKMMAESTLIEIELMSHFQKQAADHPEETSRLPKLESVKFDGNYLKWNQFWDRFVSSIDSKRLRDVDKLSYLIGSLEGKALKTVEGLAITNSNYSIAIETLKTRFGSKERVIDAHYQEILNIKRCSENADEALNNLDQIERHLRVLSSLGEDIESSHLRPIILGKFPEKIQYEVNVRISGPKTISQIRETLRSIVTAMELSTASCSSSATQFTPATSSTEALHARVVKKARFENRDPYRPPLNPISGPWKVNKGRKRQIEEAPEKKLGVKKTRKRLCLFCGGDHFNDECTAVKDIQARKDKLRGRCYNCFRDNHRYKDCKRPKKCYHCSGPHNRALCIKKFGAVGMLIPKLSTSSLLRQSYDSVSLLQTATLRILHKNKSEPCRALLDCGSQRSYITKKLANKLALSPESDELLMIFTFGSEKPTETLSSSAEVTILTKRDVQKKIYVNIVPHITDRVPIPNIKVDQVDILAEDGSAGQGIDLLLGNDYYYSLIRDRRFKINNNLYLVDTDFGWVVSGCLQKQDSDKSDILSVITYHQTIQEWICYTEPDLPLKSNDIKFLWSLENIGITDPVKATREEEAVLHFNRTVEYRDGRYYVKWPWAKTFHNLPTNYGQAYGRLKGLLQRTDKLTLEEYDDILQEQLKANIIEMVDPESELSIQRDPPLHYLPHHIVKQCGKRGRIVYDASAKTKDQLSLNECLYRGPCMLQDLTALLIGFRMYKIGILADVEKAFLQVALQNEDRDVTRFLWLKDVNKPLSNNNIVHYRFCRVPFGIISSPFLLTATIRYHILKTNEDLVERIANKCYVDNLVTGANSTDDAIKLFEETREIFQQLSMNIRDWTSNDKDFIDRIPEQCRAKKSEETKVLGLLWDKSNDSLHLKICDDLSNDLDKILTKRQVLKTLASVYDPCGFISPLLMPAKLFLQNLWEKAYKWDTPLPLELVQRWETITSSIHQAKDVAIPRYIGFMGGKNNTNVRYELHCFTDASMLGYAAAAYLRHEDGQRVKVSLIMSKARIAPLKKDKKKKEKMEVNSLKTQTNPQESARALTVPQLELLGYVIGSRLLKYLKSIITVPVENMYLWTDSLIVLNWVQSKKLLPPFTTNRVNEIRENGNMEKYYVNTAQNPADTATRPELWEQNKDLWFHGPGFLKQKRELWPEDRHLEHHQATFTLMAEGLEDHTPDVTESQQHRNDQNDKDMCIERDDQQINTEEIANHKDNQVSEVRTIKELQSRYYPEEMDGRDTHLTRNLGLFIDVDGLLRCKGRMMNTNWSYDMKHPILLPKDSEFTTNVIRETHEKNYHVGIAHTLSIIRQKFWIPQGRTQVQKIIRRCPQCIKYGGGPYKLPDTPPLPPERVNFSAPNTYIGIDYFGPVLVNSGQKRWICLYTCLVVRAIHLEVVKDLTAEECLLALRRFVAVRGSPSLILSDNAMQFKLTSEVLTSKFCTENKIRWRFIPQLAPWHGGVYERLVAVVKGCLKRTLDKHLLNDSQLLTIIKEVESVVNTRPLTSVTSDIEYVLKPADFLSLGKCLTFNLSNEQPLLEVTATKRDLIEGWRRGQRIMNDFREMFIGQYLPSLRERYRHSQKQPRVKSHKLPCVGDMVQIKGESKNRHSWKVGKITSLMKSQDGECRVAKVKVGDTEFIRSIGHLYPLEADVPNSDSDLTPIRGTGALPVEPIRDPIEHNVVEEETPQLEPGDTIEMDESMNADKTERSVEIRDLQQMDCMDVDEVHVSEDIAPEIASTESPCLDDPEDSEKKRTDETAERASDETAERANDETAEKANNETVGRMNRVTRAAAIKAKEKIAEWTRQLFTLLR